MNITIVCPSLRAGGAERATVLLAEALQGTGDAVSLVTLDRAESDFFRLSPLISRTALNLVATSHNPFAGLSNNLKRLGKLRKAVQETAPDVVISQMTQTNILTTLALTASATPIIGVEHSDPTWNAGGAVWEKLRRVSYQRLAHLVSVSKDIEQHFSWLPPEKRSVIHNPISTCHQQRPVNESSRKKQIVSVGRLIHLKGFDRLLLAFQRTVEIFPDWKLLIIGEGELRGSLESQIESLGLAERVDLPGLVQDIGAVLRQSALFVMASRREGFPYALLEAMSCGLPAIAMDCPTGPREIIRHGIDGLLVPDDDIEALAQTIKELIENSQERERLGLKARSVTERFGVPVVLGQWQDLLNKTTEAQQRWPIK